ncbi:MAG: transcription factor S [Chloroflexi bacterium]|nr:MAG: transcription factor S [Chloroflexota bacterium]
MTIKFCPKCGSMMIPEKGASEIVWKCRKCNYTEKGKTARGLVLKEKVNEKVTIPVFDAEENKDKLSTIEVECPKCGNNRAVWWIQQTRSGDEPATRFFKCVKCSYTWREYS